MPIDRLWATWRSQYLNQPPDERRESELAPGGTGSLFERILASGLEDDRTFIVRRGPTCFVLLNLFPYTSGHLMVLPNRAVADLEALTPTEHSELWNTVSEGVVAIKRAFAPHGVNVGVNLGEAAGGSQSDHLHVHCVPRWNGDTNFMGTTAEVRVLPFSLEETWTRLREAWPEPGGPDVTVS